MDYLPIIGRSTPLFVKDIENYREELLNEVAKSKFLVIGGAGSIGQAVCREIFKRDPEVLHVVDISENNMVELVRNLRSSYGYIRGDFQTFAIDCGSSEFKVLLNHHCKYDYILNLSALKHVRSEKDPFTLMRMINVNILNTIETVRIAKQLGVKKYFCVSTDKAANPVNMMGASKRIMELFLMRESNDIPISMARFANVAFSDGSLLHGFNQRFIKKQPITAPKDVRRYFVTPEESGELCLMSAIFGKNREIFFPKLSDQLHLERFSEIAKRYLNSLGYDVVECGSEEEARQMAPNIIPLGKWPCYFFNSDTTGEKDFEEFYTENEKVDFTAFENLGIVTNTLSYNDTELNRFLDDVSSLVTSEAWGKSDLVKIFCKILPNFNHVELGKSLDQRM